MGPLYLAKDTHLGRRVAIELLEASSHASSSARTVMAHHARRSAARLHHPNIVTVYQLGMHGPTPFIALEYVEGSTLERALEDGRAFTEGEVIRIGLQLADALAYAHSEDVFHGTLELSSLALDEDDTLKILDIGVTELEDAIAPSGPSTQPDIEERVTRDVQGLGRCLRALLVGLRATDHVAPTTELVSTLDACVEGRLGDMASVLDALEGAERTWTSNLATMESVPPSSLGQGLGAFIGRREERAQLDAWCAAQEPERWICIVGPGGVGKSRLALDWARRLIERDPDARAYSCVLSSAESELDIITSIASALSLDVDQSEALEQIAWTLSHVTLPVLILDDADGVLDLAQTLVSRLLERAPLLRIIMTSRVHPWHVMVRQIELDPLGTSPPGEAVALLRARLGELDDARGAWSDEHVLHAIAARLDGLPLAIELAAPRMVSMGEEEIAERLERGLDLWSSRTQRVKTGQHESLNRVIERSCALLDPVEQCALAQLSVFAGGWTLEDAEEVLDLSSEDEFAFVLDVVERLRDVSLISLDAQSHCFTMLRSVREFAADLLAERGEHEELRGRHARTFGALGEPESLARIDAGQGGALQRHIDDLNAAAAWALAQSSPDDIGVGMRALCARAALALAHGPGAVSSKLLERGASVEGVHPGLDEELKLRCGKLFIVLGQWPQGLEVFESVQSTASASGATEREARALTGLAIIHSHFAEYTHARAFYERSIELSETGGHTHTQAMAWANLGKTLRIKGELPEARRCVERALELARDIDDARMEASMYGGRGNIMRALGELDAARTWFERALEKTIEVGDLRAQANWHGGLGNIAGQRGDYDTARARFTDALKCSRRTGHRKNEGIWLGNLATLAVYERELALAEELFGQATEVARSLGDAKSLVYYQGSMGLVAKEQGRLDLALERMEAAIERAGELGAKRETLRWQVELVKLLRTMERDDDARVQRDLAMELVDELGLSPAHPLLESLQSR